MNYYNHNIGDFASEVTGFSLQHIGAFIRLIDRQASTEKPVKTEWLRLGFSEKDLGFAEEVLKALFVQSDDGWSYPPMEKIISDYIKNAEIKKENGKKGGRPRKNNLDASFEKPNNNLSVSIKTEQEPLGLQPRTNNHKPHISNNLVGTSENIDSAMYESAEDFGLEEQEKGADSEQDSQRPSNTPKRCAYTKVIELYHQLLPTLSTVNVDLFSRNRNDQAIVKARWMDFVVLEKCQTEAEVLYCFERYFQIVQKSQFLLGQTPNGSWKADFRWLMKKANFDKVLELKYS